MLSVISTLSTTQQEIKMMFRFLLVLLFFTSTQSLAEIKRYPLPNNSTFPIAQAVEVSAGTTLVYHSGTVPAPADSTADFGSRAFWGDTETQANSVFTRLQTSLNDMGLDFGDVVKMTVFLVGVPELEGRLDFTGFMRAYSKYFGTKEQANLPARSAIQVAGLAAPGLLVEVEIVLARTVEKVK